MGSRRAGTFFLKPKDATNERIQSRTFLFRFTSIFFGGTLSIRQEKKKGWVGGRVRVRDSCGANVQFFIFVFRIDK